MFLDDPQQRPFTVPRRQTTAVKLLVFAHTPPPHHGQSQMVRLLLEGFANDPAHGIECHHVNARFSDRVEDIGGFQPGKIFRLLKFCAQAVWLRFRHGVKNFYYIPAPGKRSAVYRDWLVLLLCRPFFRRIIFHWHAAGLAEWLARPAQKHLRGPTGLALRGADLSIALSEYNRADAERFSARKITIIHNGIPDPCPDFTRVKPSSGNVVNVLFLALCSREKGLFDAINGVLLANRTLAAQSSPMSLRLTIAGNFVTDADRAEFDRLLAQDDNSKIVRHLGFVDGEKKSALLREADVFCFPTFYPNENQPVNLIEAMAFGLPIVTTRWRSLPEMLPRDYPGLVPPRSPEAIAKALIALATADTGRELRENFLQRFTLKRHLAALAEALRTVETAR